VSQKVAALAPAKQSPVAFGDRVGHYQILSELGRGGMGIVFRARDLRLKREVALKCPWRELAAQPAAQERFLREARSTSRLSHPNIVPVFEIFRSVGLPWLAMDLVGGRSLRALLREGGALSVRRALQWADGLTDALRVAHENGIVHRDVTPNNILLRADDWPLLTDFGLARVLVDEDAESSASTVSDPLTAPGQVIGTRCYMSPEQVMGKRVDRRTDIFSFGAVLYEMCTGRRAFQAEEPGSEVDALLHHEPPPMAPFNGEVPAELERIVRKAMAKRPEERYGDARELRSDIVALRRRVESAEYPAPRLPRRSWLFELPVRRPVLLALALAGVTLASWWWSWHRRGPGGGLPSGTSRQVTSEPGWEAEPAISPDGSLIAYTSVASGNADIWITDLRGGSRLQLTDDPGTDSSPAWFPDGSAIAFVSDRGGTPAIWKVPRLGGSTVRLAGEGTDPAVSPDGTQVAFAQPSTKGDRIVVAHLEDPSQTVVVSGEGGRAYGRPAWSPDGRTLCYDDLRNLWLARLEGSRPRQLTRENAIDSEPVFTADGRSVVFSSYREGTQALWRVNVDGGAPERLTVGTGPESQASISLNGSRMAYSTYVDNYDIVLLDLSTGASDRVGSVLHESAPTFSPDASRIVFVSSRRSGLYDLWQQPLVGAKVSGAPRLLTDLPGTVSTPAYSPDGKWVAFKREFEGRNQIWVIAAAGGMAERFEGGEGGELNPAWSPDATQLAYASPATGESHIWLAPIRDGRRAGGATQLTSGDSVDLYPAWSWDGSRIAYVAWTKSDAEVRVVAPRGGPPRVIGRGSRIGRLRWERASGWLWFAMDGSQGASSLWKVSPEGGAPVLVKPELFRDVSPYYDFDLSIDGRFLAFTRQESHGDIWLIESRGTR
jgi:eukaryotic-like serine/threonine-protein kinase